eukprot:SAG31_NODE_2001_length_6694_cov_7.781198_2_plen_100_part_00
MYASYGEDVADLLADVEARRQMLIICGSEAIQALLDTDDLESINHVLDHFGNIRPHDIAEDRWNELQAHRARLLNNATDMLHSLCKSAIIAEIGTPLIR